MSTTNESLSEDLLCAVEVTADRDDMTRIAATLMRRQDTDFDNVLNDFNNNAPNDVSNYSVYEPQMNNKPQIYALTIYKS